MRAVILAERPDGDDLGRAMDVKRHERPDAAALAGRPGTQQRFIRHGGVTLHVEGGDEGSDPGQRRDGCDFERAMDVQRHERPDAAAKAERPDDCL